MARQTSERILADLPAFPELREVVPGGIREPLMHPCIPAMLAGVAALYDRAEPLPLLCCLRPGVYVCPGAFRMLGERSLLRRLPVSERYILQCPRGSPAAAPGAPFGSGMSRRAGPSLTAPRPITESTSAFLLEGRTALIYSRYAAQRSVGKGAASGSRNSGNRKPGAAPGSGGKGGGLRQTHSAAIET